MASSDLLLQTLMAGQQPGVDPTVAAAMPRLQLAQALMQEGTSTAPVSGGALGGLARLTQALTGNYVFDKAAEGMQGAYKNLGPQLAATLPENHPLIPALTSPDPIVRQHAVTAYDKMMPMLGGVDQARPGTTPMIGVNPAGPPTGGAVSPKGLEAQDNLHNPSMAATLGTAQGVQAATAAPGDAVNAAAVANAKVPAAIATAGGSKAAELPSVVAAQNNQGNVDVAVHSNAPQTLSPGQTTNINPNRVPMPVAPVVPHTGAPNQAAAADAILRGGLAGEAALPAGGAAPRPPAAPISPSPGMPPAVTPAPAPGAPDGPPAAAQGGQTMGSQYPPSDIMAGRYKTFSDMQSAASAARDELAHATLLQQKLHSLGSNGPATPYLANLSRYAEQSGVSPEILKKFGLPNGADEATAHALANGLAMEVARASFPVRVTNSDLQFAQTIKPSTSMPLASADYLINNTILPKAQRDIDRFGEVVDLPDKEPALGSMARKLYDFDAKRPLSSYMPQLSGQGGPAASAAPAIAPTDAHAALLRAHPDRAAEFDAKFGQGASARILGAQ